MKIALCIASRGRPQMLCDAVKNATATGPRATIAVALDLDDASCVRSDGSLHPAIAEISAIPNVVVSVAAREDSLGEKYNRAARAVSADVYVLWSDDIAVVNAGWDLALSSCAKVFGHEPGIIYFGKLEGVFQPGIAVTKSMIDAMGFFCTPYFPFWWHDTWIDEIGRLTGRIIRTDIPVKLLQGLKGASRGVQEIEFWAKLFDELRPQRMETANRIIAISNEPDWRKQQLRQHAAEISEMLLYRNSILRDPLQAKRLERHYGFDAKPDERYLRIKAQAQQMVRG